MNEAEDSFSPLEKFFKENFGGNLQFYICESVSRNQFYMRISNNLKSTELTYLPSFYIIGKYIEAVIKFLYIKSKEQQISYYLSDL